MEQNVIIPCGAMTFSKRYPFISNLIVSYEVSKHSHTQQCLQPRTVQPQRMEKHTHYLRYTNITHMLIRRYPEVPSGTQGTPQRRYDLRTAH